MRKFVLCFCLTLTLPAFAAEIKIHFNDSQAGKTPSGFHSALSGGGQPGDWKVIMAEVPSAFKPLTPQAPADSSEAVLAQTSRDPTDSRFPMLIYDGAKFKNFKLTTQFKIISGVQEQMAGIVFHYQNESNFYVVRASALGHDLRFYKVVNGQFVDPTVPFTVEVSTNVWHTLTVQCEGNEINFSLDKFVVPPIETPNTFAEGKIGFWTMSDSVTYFGDTTITYKPIVPAAQTLVENIMQEEPRILGLRIYALNKEGKTHIIGSKDKSEIGQLGEVAEKNAITNGTVSFGRGDHTVVIILPLRDRNGDPMAAVWIRLRSFFGETQDSAVTRATMIVKKMQAQVLTRADLLQ
jgi:3-keto-disaccharide hydrolase